MATTSVKPSTQKARKGSVTGSLPGLLTRTGSMADQTLLGVLNILRLDENAGNTFLVRGILPDGNPRLLSAERGMTIRDLVQGIAKEFNLDNNYQVRELPSKNILNLDANALGIENSEIAIEDVDRRMSNFELDNVHSIKDPRLRCVKELLFKEEAFASDLKCLFEVYAEPLKKWGMTRAEYQTVFEPLETICTHNAKLFRMLEDAVRVWNTATTPIGGMFVELEILWATYSDYFVAYHNTRAFLRHKREHDFEFQVFVNLQRGSRYPHMEMLLLRPLQHVTDYGRILSSLFDKTSRDHPDYTDLDRVVTKFKSIIYQREDELHAFENEVKITQVQDRFPHDNLCITEGESNQRYRYHAHRRRSAPSASIKSSISVKPLSSTVKPNSPTEAPAKIKSISEPGPPEGLQSFDVPILTRHFVQEGSAQLSVGISSQDRHLFLFSDLLIIAKPKTPATYKLKQRLRLTELWLGSCIDEVCDTIKSRDKSFVLGWPTTNCVLSFNTIEERDAWYIALAKNITIQKDIEEPRTLSLKVYNREMESPDSFGFSKSFTVTNTDDACTVLRYAIDQFQIQTEDPTEYQLWVLSGREEGACPLIGHEFPFAIKMSHIREGSSSDEEGCAFDYDQHLPAMDPVSPQTQCQFILKRRRKAVKITSTLVLSQMNTKNRQVVTPVITRKAQSEIILEVQPPSKKWKNPIKKSPIINWAMHKKTSGAKPHSNDIQPVSPGRLFGLPLQDLCTDEEPVPKPIEELMRHMFRYGPGVTGIFRKSANARRAKEVKQELDSGKEVLFEEVSVIVTASVLKEFLRRLPDCILDSEYYDDLVATNNIENDAERAQQIKLILENLSVYSIEILKRFLCVLYHIADNADVNNMTAYNLAVCVAPSMLWAPKGSSVAATEQSSAVPPVVQFMIEHFVDIFGENVLNVLGDRSEIVMNQESLDVENGVEGRIFHSQSSTDEGLDSPEPLSPKGERSSLHLSDSNLYDGDSRNRNLLSAGFPDRNSISSPNSASGSPNSSPVLRRHDMDMNQLRAAFYEPQSNIGRRCSEPVGSGPESIKMRIKGSRKFPKMRRQLSSTTTSAELIEHKQSKTTPSGRKLETAILRRAHSPQTVQALPVTENVTAYPRLNPTPTYLASVNRVPEFKHAAVKTQGSTSSEPDVTSPGSPVQRSPSPTPDQVFQAVDRRRQPAAPSYHQHMLRKVGNKPQFFQGGGEGNGNAPSGKEVEEDSEERDPWQQRAVDRCDRSVSVPSTSAFRRPDKLDLSQSEPTTPVKSTSPFPLNSPDQNWPDHRDDTSTSSGGSTSRRLEHSPFGLNLHHRRTTSEGGKRVQRTTGTGSQLRSTLNNKQCLYNGGGSPHFPPSEFFPQEATRAKPPWGNDTETSFNVRNTTTTYISRMGTSDRAVELRRGSQTSSSSSVSSMDDRSSVGADSVSENKTDVTQIRDLKDLLSEQAQANGLKISAETAEEIAKVKEIWIPKDVPSTDYTSPSHDDIEKMMFTEESYV
ncbi:uncharacterized protein LOC5510315 isoform X1 [Nematostella vectensis]|uniref:uncharacterized protein LOC5510315 isoform X1 n=1 Tax=Nematostella vectensis TaxID=45351 RepID=UPI0013901454|nr:uncharacterized protein LOC5510315 isoform X1 [Nematostella vectensis]XP_032235344.1 uncharacterized protein LOC5510315 isoform X1 [Nematostella vectensis]